MSSLEVGTIQDDHTPLVYQFAATLLMEGYCTSMRMFEFEDLFDCWDCRMTGRKDGVPGGKPCPECGGKGYKFKYWAAGAHLDFEIGGTHYETQLHAGLLQNYSQKATEKWKEFSRLKPSFRIADFAWLPMRRLGASAKLTRLHADRVFPVIERVVNGRKRDIRRAAAMRKKQGTVGDVPASRDDGQGTGDNAKSG